jgi:hypothetical protein
MGKKPRIKVEVTQMVKFKNQHNQKEGVKQGGKRGWLKDQKNQGFYAPWLY